MDYSVAQAHGGHRPAIAAVVESLRPRITRMAAYYARRTGHDPDDLVQEAWVGLLEALPNLRLAVGSPDQHLIQRARWRLLDAVRRERLRRCLPLDAAGDRVAADAGVAAMLSRALLDGFSERLSPMQRSVLACLLEGLTWREAGDALGCTSANIAHHVRRIRREYEAWAA
jgi:RNA polymerase sigma-70 factor (ECF subfamily)